MYNLVFKKVFVLFCFLSLSIHAVERSCGIPINEEERRLFAAQFPPQQEAFNISPDLGKAIFLEKNNFVISKYNDLYKTLRFSSYAYTNGYIDHIFYTNCRITLYLDLLKKEAEPRMCTTLLIFPFFEESLKSNLNRVLYDAERKISKELPLVVKKSVMNGANVVTVLYGLIRDFDDATENLQRKIIACYNNSN